MKNDALALGLGLVTAATLQDWWPALPLVGGKPPWLMAVALYYGAERGPWAAALSAVLAGLWLDGLSGGPVGPAVLTLGMMQPFLFRLRRLFPAWGARTTLIGGGVISPLLSVIALCGIRLAGYAAPLAALPLAARIVVAAPVGAATALLMRAALGGLDRIMGNVPLRKEVNADPWTHPH